MFDKDNWYIEEKNLTEEQFREVCQYLVENHLNKQSYSRVDKVAGGGLVSNTGVGAFDAVGVIKGNYYVDNLLSVGFTGCTKITYQEFYDNLLNPWIDWNGDECPVDEGVEVDVMYRNGDINFHVKAGVSVDAGGSVEGKKATCWGYVGYHTSYDIIKYRLHKPSRPTAQQSDTKSQVVVEKPSQSLTEAFKTIQSFCADKGLPVTVDSKGDLEVLTSYGDFVLNVDGENFEEVLEHFAFVNNYVKENSK